MPVHWKSRNVRVGTKNTNLVAHYLHSTLYDYTKFLRCAGDTPLTANWAVGNFDITGIDDITATTGTITTATLPTANITTGNITTGKITTLNGDMSGASSYQINNLTNLGTVAASITGTATIGTGNINTGKISTLNGNMAAGNYDITGIDSIYATKGTIETLSSTTATIATGNITTGKITNLNGNMSGGNTYDISNIDDISCTDISVANDLEADSIIGRTNVDFTINLSDTGNDFYVKDDSGGEMIKINSLGAEAKNYISIYPGRETVITDSVRIAAEGTNSNINIFLVPNGTGNVISTTDFWAYDDLKASDDLIVSDDSYLSGNLSVSGSFNLIDTTSTLAANSDSLIASQKATKTYVDGIDYIITQSIDLYTTRDDSGNVFTTTTEPKIYKDNIYEPVMLLFDDAIDSTACFVLSITLPTNLTGSNVIIGLVGLNDQAGNSYYDVEYYQTDITKTWETTPVYNQLLINDLNIMKDTFTITNATASQTIFFKIWRNSALSSSIKGYLLKFVYAYHIDPD